MSSIYSEKSISIHSNLPAEVAEKMFFVILLNHFSEEPNYMYQHEQIEAIVDFYCIEREDLIHIAGFYIQLLVLFTSCRAYGEFKEKLHDLGFTDQFIATLPLSDEKIAAMMEPPIELEVGLLKHANQSLTSIKWRIDISLTNSNLAVAKKVPTSVMICLQFRNDRKCTFNVDIRTFHKLRFNIALLLKELISYKSKAIKV